MPSDRTIRINNVLLLFIVVSSASRTFYEGDLIRGNNDCGSKAAVVEVARRGWPESWPPGPLVFGGTEFECVSVWVGNRSQKSNRTLAVQRRNDGDGDFIAGMEGIRSI